MDIIHLLETVSGVVVSTFGVLKAWFEWKAAYSKNQKEINESGDANQANPRS